MSAPPPPPQRQGKLEKHWQTYAAACYADTPLSAYQLAETRQAFFSGLLLAATQSDEDLRGLATEGLESLRHRIAELLKEAP